MDCQHCGKPLDKKVQRMAPLGYEYDIYTCWTVGCPGESMTFSGEKRPLQPVGEDPKDSE